MRLVNAPISTNSCQLRVCDISCRVSIVTVSSIVEGFQKWYWTFSVTLQRPDVQKRIPFVLLNRFILGLLKVRFDCSVYLGLAAGLWWWHALCLKRHMTSMSNYSPSSKQKTLTEHFSFFIFFFFLLDREILFAHIKRLRVGIKNLIVGYSAILFDSLWSDGV